VSNEDLLNMKEMG